MRVGSRRLRFQAHGRHKFVIFLVIVAAIVVFVAWLCMGGLGKLMSGTGTGATPSGSAMPVSSYGADASAGAMLPGVGASAEPMTTLPPGDVTVDPNATVDPNVATASALPAASGSQVTTQAIGTGGAALLGNSNLEDLNTYGLLPDADFYYKVGLTVTDAMTTPAEGGTVPAIDELQGKDYDKVFLMFGNNELGWTKETFLADYSTLIQEVRSYNPNARIYVMGILPITKETSDKGENGATQARIDEYNEDLKTLANSNDCYFMDLGMAFKDSTGYLPAEAAADGVHLNKEYSTAWAQILRNEIGGEMG